MTDALVQHRPERGRPRSGTARRPDLSATEQILDAAAQLFVERGFAATSTRAIADGVGIRQASLYYHFPSKEQILKVLLMRTVEPSVRVAAYLDAATDPAVVRLAALIGFDTGQLARSSYNIGSLYFLPEIRNELLEPFRLERARLRDTYAALIMQSVEASVRADLGPSEGDTGSALDYLVDVIFGLVESVIAIRADRPDEDAQALVSTILYSSLRVLGHDGESGRRITERAGALLAGMPAAPEVAES
ncbi:helix-turn-helix domain containing protein [Cryobacterium sp. SO2]|uniref:TetR/AcrR family transcriptional regulator n=1 Tax=Cryobacterium sp. SO2 TaxID=1897060 RepID=UPI00223D1577|nr:TetR/AcrR family transcriptional regulator [Cryobacterium sp. SO2]WEO75799.1 helix-turn-helix domain containing protein [Cryobacterium sp. SO2]